MLISPIAFVAVFATIRRAFSRERRCHCFSRVYAMSAPFTHYFRYATLMPLFTIRHSAMVIDEQRLRLR